MASVVEEAPDEETVPLRAMVEQQAQMFEQQAQMFEQQTKQIAAMQAQIHSLTAAAYISKQPKGDDTAINASKTTAIIDEQSGSGGITTSDAGKNGKDAEPGGDDEETNIYEPSGKKEPCLSATTITATTTTTTKQDGTTSSGGVSSEEQAAGEDGPPSTAQPTASGPGSFWPAQVLSSKLGRKNNDALPQTVYSILYLATCESPAFLYAFFVFVLQAGMIVLVLMDQINIDTIDRNPFSIPAGVPPQVTAAQATCLFVAVALQDDFIQAVNTFNGGHDRELTKKQDFEAATVCKFCISVILQLLVGLAQLVATFALVMSSETVIEVFLNFAGLSFVSMVDDAGFLIAAHGYLPRSIQSVCQQAQAVKRKAPMSFWLPRLLSLLAIAGLMTMFGITLNQQLKGSFLCQKLYVQFGDEIRIEYGAFSGEYFIQPDKQYGGRVSYLEVESMKSGSGRSMIAYCDKLEAWTHSSWNLTNNELPDPCAMWKARSADKTTAYDVLETSNAPWVITSDTTGLPGPLDWLYMACNDCNDATCNPEHGFCSDNDCVCHSGRMGLNCVFGEACDVIARDANTLFSLSGVRERRYSLLRDANDAKVLHRRHPIYVRVEEFLHSQYFMVFTGRRWAIVLFYNYPLDGAVDFLENDFHAAYDNSIGFLKLSAPVDVSKQMYQVAPVGLSWHTLETTSFRSTWDDKPDDAIYLCTRCNKDANPCLWHHDDACNLHGVCRCKRGYVGALCEAHVSCDMDGFPCQNNGTCTSAGTCDCGDTKRYYGAYCELDQLGYSGLDFAEAVQGLHEHTSECGCWSTLQLEYRGGINNVNGTPCFPWTQVDSVVREGRPQDAPELGLEANFCRNPRMLVPRAYCFINETYGDYCNVPFCAPENCPNLNEICGCMLKWSQASDGSFVETPYGQQNYRGAINVTSGGRPCLRWDSHSYPITPDLFPDAGLDGNYCRNPTPEDMDGVWCYTDGPDDFYQPCDVPRCPDMTCSDWSFDLYNSL